jgi:hypothetical protein
MVWVWDSEDLLACIFPANRVQGTSAGVLGNHLMWPAGLTTMTRLCMARVIAMTHHFAADRLLLCELGG